MFEQTETCGEIPQQEEGRPRAVSAPYLYSAVAPVSHDDVSVNVHSHTRGSVELAVSFTVRAKLQHQFALRSENLPETSEQLL